MKSINKLFFALIALISMQINCMEISSNRLPKAITGSPEEIKVITMYRDLNKYHKKLVAFTLVMRESLKPTSPFINKLVEKKTTYIASLKGNKGHTGDVNSVSFSHDGNYAISGSDDSTMWTDDVAIKFWDVSDKQNPKELATLTGHTKSVESVSFSPDGNYAISASDDGTIKLWDVTNKQTLNPNAIATLTGHNDWVRSVSFSPDGNYAISASDDGTIKLWDVIDKQNPKELATLTGHNDWVRSVSFSPDGNYAISGSNDKTIKLWDVSDKNNPKELATLKGHDGPVASVSISPDGNYAISGSWDETIKLWDITDKNNTKTNPIATLTGHNGWVTSVSFSPDGNFAISGSNDSTIKLWDVTDKKNPKTNPIDTLKGHTRAIASVSFSPDGNYAISGSDDSTIKLWDLSFLKIPDYITKLVNSRDGIFHYLLLSSILEFRKKQQTTGHELYTANPAPFSISYPKLKTLFKNLPDKLKDRLIEQNYVFLK